MNEKIIWWKTTSAFGYNAEPVEVIALTEKSIKYWERDFQGNRTRQTTARYKSEWCRFFSTAKEAADFLQTRINREKENYQERLKEFEKIHRQLLAAEPKGTRHE